MPGVNLTSSTGIELVAECEIGLPAGGVLAVERDGVVGNRAVAPVVSGGRILDRRQRLVADGLEGVPPGGVIFPDARAAVERAAIVAGRGVHTEQHLRAVSLRGFDRKIGRAHV